MVRGGIHSRAFVAHRARVVDQDAHGYGQIQMLNRIDGLRNSIFPNAEVVSAQIHHRLALRIHDCAIQQDLVHICVKDVYAILLLLDIGGLISGGLTRG